MKLIDQPVSESETITANALNPLTCECLHDPDDIALQNWEDGWPCGEPATHSVRTSCDCSQGCEDQFFLMCADCVDGAIELGDVVSVYPL